MLKIDKTLRQLIKNPFRVLRRLLAGAVALWCKSVTAVALNCGAVVISAFAVEQPITLATNMTLGARARVTRGGATATSEAEQRQHQVKQYFLRMKISKLICVASILIRAVR